MSSVAEKQAPADKALQKRIWEELPLLLFIPLTQGKFAVIDGADYPLIRDFKWYYCRSRDDAGYAQANAKNREPQKSKKPPDAPKDY